MTATPLEHLVEALRSNPDTAAAYAEAIAAAHDHGEAELNVRVTFRRIPDSQVVGGEIHVHVSEPAR